MEIWRFVELCFGYVIVWNCEVGDFLARSGRSEIPSNIATWGPLSVTVGLIVHRAVETSDILDAENYIRRSGDDAAVCGFAPCIGDDHHGLLDSDLNGKGHFENECSELPCSKN